MFSVKVTFSFIFDESFFVRKTKILNDLTKIMKIHISIFYRQIFDLQLIKSIYTNTSFILIITPCKINIEDDFLGIICTDLAELS